MTKAAYDHGDGNDYSSDSADSGSEAETEPVHYTLYLA